VRLGAGREDIAWHGNVLLLRHGATVTEVERIALPSLEEQRGAVIVDVAVHGIQLRVVAMHLGLIGLWRTRQAIALLERMKAFESRLPTVMLGDTNEWTPGGTCLVHFSREHRVAALGRSFPSRLPIFALDKIMFSSDLQVTASGVHDTPLARVASDHLPVWAQLSLVSAKAVG
jgi:endonuclease/exonuclease/phosphatase family metal-dependent hydrolase